MKAGSRGLVLIAGSLVSMSSVALADSKTKRPHEASPVKETKPEEHAASEVGGEGSTAGGAGVVF
jgi:hypothetical protein